MDSFMNRLKFYLLINRRVKYVHIWCLPDVHLKFCLPLPQVIRLEGQVTRYRSASERSEASEDELKVEKRKLQREESFSPKHPLDSLTLFFIKTILIFLFSSSLSTASCRVGPSAWAGGRQRSSDQTSGEDEGQSHCTAGPAVTTPPVLAPEHLDWLCMLSGVDGGSVTSQLTLL